MGTRVSFTKQEIKQDKFADFMARAREFVTENAAAVSGVVLAVILLIVGVYFYTGSSESSRDAAGQALSQAKNNLAGGNLQIAMLEFRSIADENRGSKFGAEALYILGSAQFLAGNFAESQRVFEEYVDRYSRIKISYIGAVAGIAASMENTGQFASAAEKFMEALDEDPGGPVAEDYVIGALRNYLLAGDNAAARNLYDRILESFWQSNVVSAADRLMNEFRAAG